MSYPACYHFNVGFSLYFAPKPSMAHHIIQNKIPRPSTNLRLCLVRLLVLFCFVSHLISVFATNSHSLCSSHMNFLPSADRRHLEVIARALPFAHKALHYGICPVCPLIWFWLLFKFCLSSRAALIGQPWCCGSLITLWVLILLSFSSINLPPANITYICIFLLLLLCVLSLCRDMMQVSWE